MSHPQRLLLDPVRCDGHGHCADLLPEMVRLDEWGYPIMSDADVTASTRAAAKRAVSACPVLALRLARA